MSLCFGAPAVVVRRVRVRNVGFRRSRAVSGAGRVLFQGGGTNRVRRRSAVPRAEFVLSYRDQRTPVHDFHRHYTLGKDERWLAGDLRNVGRAFYV